MARKTNGNRTNRLCGVCGQYKPEGDLVRVEVVRPQIASLIAVDHPDWQASGLVCKTDLIGYRHRYVTDLIVKERGELTTLDEAVVRSLARHETLTNDIEATFEERLSFADRLSDKVAAFGGSWGFIVVFSSVMVAWIIINVTSLLSHPFDPYPFILLNLMLSFVAAFQAPLIMMSQRRLEAKDRLRSQNDYKVNLKAELEIRHLHEKVDHLLLKQWERLAEIQEIQIELMEDIARKGR